MMHPHLMLFVLLLAVAAFLPACASENPAPKVAEPPAASSANLPAPYIAAYRNDCKGAFSFTCDDGFRHQVQNTCEIIEPLDFRATFFIIPPYIEPGPKRKDNVITWDEVKALRAKGHEIGTHGSIKEKLHEATPARLDELINGSWESIQKNAGVRSVSYANPGGSKSTEPVVAKIKEKHVFHRNGKSLPNVKIMGYGNTGRRKWDDQATRKAILAAADKGQWCIAILHAIAPGGGWSPFKSKEEFAAHCQWLADQKDNIWVAPMGVVGRYVFLRDASKIHVQDQCDFGVSFSITVDPSLKPAEVFDVPLTVVIPAPGVKAVIIAAQKISSTTAKSLKTTLRNGKILLNVRPSRGPVTVQWKK